MTSQTERYEVRLYRIGDQEECVESREVPSDAIQGQASELPNREAMSLVNANLAAPINLAAAINLLSDNSIAVANAEQYAPINQNI
jgi:hypothetical protein